MGDLVGCRTLRLRWTAITTPALAALLLALGVGLCEVVVRIVAVRTRLSAPSRGTPFPYLEMAISHLDALVAREGRVDCLFMGSSAAASAIDPDRFATSYAATTGRPIRCFNAALPGLPVAAAGTLGTLLVRRYRPRLLVYGTIPRDFSLDAATQFGGRLEESVWVRHQLGDPTIEGWLLEHLLSYREYLTYRQLLDPSGRVARAAQQRQPEISASGFLPLSKNAEYLIHPGTDPDALPMFTGHDMAPQAMPGLTIVSGLQVDGLRVLLLALPVHPSLLTLTDDARQDYAAIVARLAAHARTHAVTFWETLGAGAVPDDGWADIVHMNVRGAERYSDWLGRRVGEAVRQGELRDPVA